jgi:hypothetical protein
VRPCRYPSWRRRAAPRPASAVGGIRSLRWPARNRGRAFIACTIIANFASASQVDRPRPAHLPIDWLGDHGSVSRRTYSADVVSALLTSDVYGLRSELDPTTLGKLDLRRRLAIKEDRTEKEEQPLAELNDWIRTKDFTRSDPDPMFTAFEEAMTRAQQAEKLKGPTLTEDQRKRQKELAFTIVTKLKAEEKGGDTEEKP